jgi:hypothetical protein
VILTYFLPRIGSHETKKGGTDRENPGSTAFCFVSLGMYVKRFADGHTKALSYTDEFKKNALRAGCCFWVGA